MPVETVVSKLAAWTEGSDGGGWSPSGYNAIGTTLHHTIISNYALETTLPTSWRHFDFKPPIVLPTG